jgi:hypothetical protein
MAANKTPPSAETADEYLTKHQNHNDDDQQQADRAATNKKRAGKDWREQEVHKYLSF